VHPARRLGVWLLAMAALGSSEAWATDIQCATTQQPAERVICDHAILDNEYDGIFAQQQAMLSSGKISSVQLAQWRQARNACVDVHCIDGVFDNWKAMARQIEAGPQAAASVVAASETAIAPVGPNPEAPPVASAPDSSQAQAFQAVPTSEASLVRQGSAAGVALPQPVAPQASAPGAAAAASAASESRGMAGLPGLNGGLLALLFVAIAAGVFFALRNRSGARSKAAKRVPGRDGR
jgi:uncharacterized protein